MFRMTGEILTLKDVAALLKVAEKTVYTIARRREIPCFKVRGQWRFRRRDLEAWLEAFSVGETKPSSLLPPGTVATLATEPERGKTLFPFINYRLLRLLHQQSISSVIMSSTTVFVSYGRLASRSRSSLRSLTYYPISSATAAESFPGMSCSTSSGPTKWW